MNFLRSPLIVLCSAVIVLIFTAFFLNNSTPKKAYQEGVDDKISKLKLQPNFKAEHLYSSSDNKQGSWVAMTFDDKGRLIVSDQFGGLYRLQVPAIGSQNLKPIVEKIMIENDTITLGAAHGLLYAFNSLYLMVNNNSSKKLPKTSGLYRLQDTDNNDKFDKLTLLKELKGSGEHGPHSIILSPDKKSIYVISGNYTDVPEMNAHRMPTNWQYDHLFPAIKDPRGHANDRKEPGGWIAHIDPEGKHWDMISAGYRNAFDITFNEMGDLFVYDADMEWDFGLPWYRPTRICHATSGSDFGWRTGNGKFPSTFPDNLPPVINIGQGSPTNLLHLKDAKFPAKYKQSMLAFDWSFGIAHAIHLKPSGATYTAEREEFLSGIPLPLTDGIIGPDGALYFMTGGRSLQSDLYRVYYTGNENTNAPTGIAINKENTLRRSLEVFHKESTKEAISVAWPQLKHPDRFVRYAARIAIEKRPVAEWQKKALTETDPVALVQAMIALARQGNAELKNDMLQALMKIDFGTFAESQKLDILRAFELVFSRMGEPAPNIKKNVISYLDKHFPAKSDALNRELSKNLIFLESPTAVTKTMALLDKKEALSSSPVGGQTATTSADLIMRNPQYGLDIAKMLEKIPPAQQTYLATMLSAAKTGWNDALREKYFSWFKNAFSYGGGMSYVGFIDKARKLALKNVPQDKVSYYDKRSGAELLTKSGNEIANTNGPKGQGKSWKLNEASKLFEQPLSKRSFSQGKAMYTALTCNRCHTMGGEGSNIGPELAQLATRFSTKDILEAIIDPSKSVSDQYAATQWALKNGETIVGRMVNQDKAYIYVSQNPYSPTTLLKIAKKNVVSSKYSSVSIMLPGLINRLDEEELKDLMAYLMAGGNENNGVFR